MSEHPISDLVTNAMQSIKEMVDVNTIVGNPIETSGGVTIIPTTIISMRAMYGSVNPTEVIPTCILATMCSSISGLLLDYFIRRKNGDI